MIKYHVSRKKRIKIDINGTPKELCNETAILVSQIYKAIKKKDQEDAKRFQNDLLTVLLAPGSPVWKEETPK